MNSYEKAIKITGKSPEITPQKFVYMAYKNGTGTQFINHSDALLHSKLIERICVNQHEVDQSVKNWSEYQNKLISNLQAILHEKYNYPFFHIVYEKAKELSDYDFYIVEEYIDHLIEVIQKVKSL